MSTRQYVCIPANGQLPTSFIVDEHTEMHHLQLIVGGYIERVSVWANHSLIVNEEGLLKGLPVNWTAMFLASRFGAAYPLVGDAVLVGPIGDDQEFTSASDEMLELAQLIAKTDSALVNPDRGDYCPDPHSMPDPETVAEAASDPVRMARCSYYGKPTRKTGRGATDCECGRCRKLIDPATNRGLCQCERPSDPKHMAFFASYPDRQFDAFYCGCQGWD